MIVATALLNAGVIEESDCRAAMERAERIPAYACQDLRLPWRIPRENAPCEVCGDPSRRYGLCWRCEQGKAALYHANGKRRRFILSENE